jgi:biotin-dependent carboxylase-like uncharacterized protein
LTTFKVLKTGPLVTIQDAGRVGYSHLGLTEGGAMDYRSFAIANRLVGNSTNSAALEITLGGVEFECQNPVTIALTGAFCPMTINDQPKALWQTHQVTTGDRIAIGFAALGVRAYLAISGGIKSESWFGSQSTVLREGIGKALTSGDLIKVNESSLQLQQRLDFRNQPSLRKSAELEFVPGYQWDQIPNQEQQTFLNNDFEITARNDRMGCQLQGPKIHTHIEKLYSEGISAGSIQITGEGDPIILMRDRQTIGGYPKLGAITTASQSILAQMTQHSRVRFKAISAEQSVERFRAFYHELETLEFL